jgi:hypothetical protein
MENITALFIFEALGRPPEHIKQALEGVVERLGKIKGVEVTSKTIHEPKLIEDEKAKGKNLHTTFAEVEAKVDKLNLLFSIVVNMLPASVEIIKPDRLVLKNFDLSSVLGELALNIHRYDDIAKSIMIERKKMIVIIRKMENKIKELGGTLEDFGVKEEVINTGESQEEQKEEKLKEEDKKEKEEKQGEEDKKEKEDKKGEKQGEDNQEKEIDEENKEEKKQEAEKS